MSSKEEKFNCWVPAQLIKGRDSQGDEKWVIQGIASTATKDLQGEIVDQTGIDVTYFLNKGYFNYDHKPGAEYKVGEPTECRITKDGLFVKGWLYKDKKAAQDLWEHFNALNKSGSKRKMGFSIEGRVERRNGNVIEKCWIQDIAITPAPVNHTTWAEVVKSLSAATSTGSDDSSDELSYEEVEATINELCPGLDPGTVRAVADLLTE
jgi:hypothetical protein